MTKYPKSRKIWGMSRAAILFKEIYFGPHVVDFNLVIDKKINHKRKSTTKKSIKPVKRKINHKKICGTLSSIFSKNRVGKIKRLRNPIT